MNATSPGEITTIALSPYIFIQGALVARLPDGDVTVRVDERSWTGTPIREAGPAFG